MTNQEIIDNAPEPQWNMHSAIKNKYYFLEANRLCVWLGECWSVQIANELEAFLYNGLRSRADIERIVALEVENERLNGERDDLLRLIYKANSYSEKMAIKAYHLTGINAQRLHKQAKG